MAKKKKPIQVVSRTRRVTVAIGRLSIVGTGERISVGDYLRLLLEHPTFKGEGGAAASSAVLAGLDQAQESERGLELELDETALRFLMRASDQPQIFRVAKGQA